jgi:peptide/nickel transport system substrate-binding protein
MHSGENHRVSSHLARGRLSRREAIRRLGALGMSWTAIGAVLAGAFPRATRAGGSAGRGGSGVLTLASWQAPTILNAHLAQSPSDFTAARLCTEPLLTVDAAGAFTPVLAADVPSRANGGVAADGRWVTYRLREGVRWADGRPFTADDVVFTHSFITNRQTAATTYGAYVNVEKVEAVDPVTVRITFRTPTPAWYVPFVGEQGQILPRHALDAYIGDAAHSAPFNTAAFGTGPYVVDAFRPGDRVVYRINEYYRDPARPAFEGVQITGGGDAADAARAVLVTGEVDYAWNTQLEWPVLEGMAEAGKGIVLTETGQGVEQIYCNMTDPTRDVAGQRSSVRSPHPFLTDPRVRQAMGLAIDRRAMATQLYGGEGEATPNVLTTPVRLTSRNTRLVYDVAKANQLLDEAGWRRGPDGIRSKGGVRLEVTFVTTVAPLRQKEQEIVKEGWTKIGIAVTLRAVDAAAFLNNAPENAASYAHFYSDVEMLTSTYTSPFPNAYMARFYSEDPERTLAQQENNWTGLNICRWVDREFNRLFDQAHTELDPKKNDALWTAMNDLVVAAGVTLPLIDRRLVSVRSNTLEVGANLSPFDSETRNIADWKRLA